MKVRNAEGFLFPASQLDFRHDATLYPSGALHGLGALNGSPAFEAAIRAQTAKFNYELKKVSQADWLAAAAGVDYGALSDAELNKAIRIGYEYAVNGQAAGDAMRAAEDQNIQAAAAQQAANAAATAAAQAAAEAAARQAAAQAESAARQAAERAQADAVAKAAAATKHAQEVQAVIDAQLAAQQSTAAADAQMRAKLTQSFSLDADVEGTMFLIGKRGDGSTYVAATGAGNIDEYLTRNYPNLPRDTLATTASYEKAKKSDAAVAAAATSTQKTVVNLPTSTVQTVDAASGTTSTVNAQTGSVRLTLSDGTTKTGTGSVTAGGVTTTVNPTTGVVTTQNVNTGVATQTNAATGQTQTAVQVTGTAATGGTFMLPDGKTVTTTKSITSAALSPGHIALAALVGILLLRGAIK